MYSQKTGRSKRYTVLALSTLLLLVVWPALSRAVSMTDQHRLEKAWRFAGQVGSYEYQTNAVQTTHPTQGVRNAGRSSRSKHFAISGMMDKTNEIMVFKLDNVRGQQALEIKVEDGVTYGRASADDEWAQTDDADTDLFAPGGDPLGFLNAAKDTRLLDDAELEERDPLAYNALSSQHTLEGYAFELDGPSSTCTWMRI